MGNTLRGNPRIRMTMPIVPAALIALPSRLTRRAAREWRAPRDRRLESARFRARLLRFTARRLALLRHTILLCNTRPARSFEAFDSVPFAHRHCSPAESKSRERLRIAHSLCIACLGKLPWRHTNCERDHSHHPNANDRNGAAHDHGVAQVGH